MRKWLGFFSIVHRQAILSKAGRYMELKKLSIEDWAPSVKLNRRGDVLLLFTLCALTSHHVMVHLRNGILWTTVDTPESYDHDELLSICDIHLAYIGNGQFTELGRKTEPSGTTGITCKTVTHLAGDSGTTIGTTCSANENNN